MAMQGCVRLCEAMHGCVLAVQGYAWLCMGGLGLMGVVWPLLLSIRVAPIVQFLICPPVPRGVQPVHGYASKTN